MMVPLSPRSSSPAVSCLWAAAVALLWASSTQASLATAQRVGQAADTAAAVVEPPQRLLLLPGVVAPPIAEDRKKKNEGLLQGQPPQDDLRRRALPKQDDKECQDSPLGWYDADGPWYHCEWYAQRNHCQRYGHDYANQGATANAACCVCGGGTTEPPLVVVDDDDDDEHCPTATPMQLAVEEAVLDLVNQARQQTTDCGSEGIFAATHPLTLNPALRCASRYHSKWMMEHNAFSHSSPNGALGVEFWNRAATAGYAGYVSGENIALGFGAAQAVVHAWLQSDGHCANIMSNTAMDMGIGIYGSYWTQVFGY